MKKMLKLFTLLSILMLATAAVQAVSVESPAIDISLMNQDPDPVTPGRYVELRFSVQNKMANTVAKSFEVMLDTQYPFSLDPTESSMQSLGDLPALGAGNNVFVVKYKVRIDDKAVQGSTPITLKYRHEGTDWIGLQFNVDIRTLDANLAVISVTTKPEIIAPGDEANISIKLKNMADSVLRDVTVKLDLTFSSFLDRMSTITATDSINAYNILPFAPVDSATEQKLYTLSPGEEQTFTYHLITYADAEAKVYKVPVIITYRDEQQISYTKSDVIGLIVGAKPDLSAVIDETDLYAGKQTGTVTVKFINKGFTGIKFLDVRLQDSEDFEKLCCDEVYIGNVDSDDYETADFKIMLKNAVAADKSVPMKVDVEYRDANNHVYKDSYLLSLKVLSAQQLGAKSGNSTLTILVIVVIAGGAVYFYLRRRKKN
jgi:LPXTG-motif cell wall-anchored protein